MVQLKFSVTEEAAAYLQWYARNVLYEKGENEAARHLMMRQLEEIRRQYRKDDPTPADLNMVPTAT